jgi:hypothetical protein
MPPILPFLPAVRCAFNYDPHFWQRETPKTKTLIMPILRPFNLQKWIDENRDLLKPPVSNKNLYVQAGDFIVMIVGGPNARKDYHFNESEELFYQLEGDINVRIQEDGKAVFRTLQ